MRLLRSINIHGLPSNHVYTIGRATNNIRVNLIFYRDENLKSCAIVSKKKLSAVYYFIREIMWLSLTSYIQGLALLAFTDFVRDLALYGRVVELASSVVNDHLRGVVPDHLFLVDKPPGKGKRNKRHLKRREDKIASPLHIIIQPSMSAISWRCGSKTHGLSGIFHNSRFLLPPFYNFFASPSPAPDQYDFLITRCI